MEQNNPAAASAAVTIKTGAAQVPAQQPAAPAAQTPAAPQLTPEQMEAANAEIKKATGGKLDLKAVVEAAKNGTPAPTPATNDGIPAKDTSDGDGSDDNPWYKDTRFWIGVGVGAATIGVIFLAIELFSNSDEVAV